MSQEQTLEPCPHCGKSHTLKIVLASEHWADEYDGYYPHSERYAVMCDASSPNGPGGCGASGGFKATEAEAIAVWNRRAALSATQPAQAAPEQPADPCPQCETGGVCSKNDCGRKRSSDLMGLYGTAKPDQAAQGEPVVPPELDVRRIMLDIAPGDGDGFEVYAKTVDDVVAKLTEMGERIESLEGAQPAAGADVERAKALQYCDEVELQIMEVANGVRKLTKVEFQPIGRLIEFIRNGKTFGVSLTYKPRSDAAIAASGRQE